MKRTVQGPRSARRGRPHGLNEFEGNQNHGLGNWSVGNVSLLSTRKASAAGERWSTGVSAQPTVHRLDLWSARLSIAGAHSYDRRSPRPLLHQPIDSMIG